MAPDRVNRDGALDPGTPAAVLCQFQIVQAHGEDVHRVIGEPAGEATGEVGTEGQSNRGVVEFPVVE